VPVTNPSSSDALRARHLTYTCLLAGVLSESLFSPIHNSAVCFSDRAGDGVKIRGMRMRTSVGLREKHNERSEECCF
jgi:hypothetical protein